MATIVFFTWAQFHDPDADERFMFLFTLDAGRSLIAAQVDVVDPTSSTVDGATDLVVSDTQFGPTTVANQWAVSLRVRGGSALTGNVPKDYFVRCRYTIDSTPPTIGDRTQRLRVKQL